MTIALASSSFGALDVSTSSGASATASAAAATPAAARIHQSRLPVCQRLKKCRIAATIAKIASRTSHAWSLPNASGKWPASIVKTTGRVR